MRKTTVFIASILFFIPTVVFSYSPTTTHTGLTEQVIEFYKMSFGENITENEKELMIDGAIEEDNPPTRALNHFYDPVRNIGINGGNTSKRWALDGSLVANDYSWPKIIKYYAEGDREKALLGLGHILHLIEDASVPEHTRNDPHIGDGSTGMFTNKSPFEEWTNENKTRDTLKGLAASFADEDVLMKNSLGEYFDFIAGYSNANFYSLDTIDSDVYQYVKPYIVEYDDKYAYWNDVLTGKKEILLFTNTKRGSKKVEYSINKNNDTTILSSYFNRLSKQAVLAGAGVTDLFFREAEEARLKYLAQQKQEQEKETRKAQELANSLSRSGFIGLVYSGFKMFVVDKIVMPVALGTNFAINSFKSGTLAIGQGTGNILAIGKFSAGTAATIGVNKANEATNKVKEKVMNVLDEAQIFVQSALNIEIPKGTNEAFLVNIVNDKKLEDIANAIEDAKNSILDFKKDVESFSENKKETEKQASGGNETPKSKYLLLAYSPGFGGGGGGGGSSPSSQTSEQNNQKMETQEQTDKKEVDSTASSGDESANEEDTSTASSTPPIITSPGDFSLSFATTTIAFEGTATASSTVEVLYQRLVGDGATTTEKIMATTTVSTDGFWFMDLVFSTGTTTISFVAISVDGEKSTSTNVILNISLFEENSQEQKEENIPQSPIVLSPVDEFVSTNTAILFSGMASSTSIILTDFSSATTTVNEIGEWSLLLSEFEQGTTTISFSALDAAGGTSTPTEISVFIDSVAPEMSRLTVLECTGTLSVDKEVCLIPNLTLNISWLSLDNDISYYSINNNGSVSTTTATSTVVVIPPDDLDDENNILTFNFSVFAVDQSKNISTRVSKFIEINLYPLIINEVAWAGTVASSADEWIEIANNTIHKIDLSSVVLESGDGSPRIELSGTIPRFSYYLIERKNDGEEYESTQSPVTDVVADVWTSFGGGLKNTGEVLSLLYTSVINNNPVVLDSTPDISECDGWCGGTAGATYFSMERISQYESGLDGSNWKPNDGVVRNGIDVDGSEINGTPRYENSFDTEDSDNGGGNYDFDAGDIAFPLF